MMAFGLVYFALLTGILVYAAKSRWDSWPTWMIAVFILFWTDLVLTAHVLSIFSALNSITLYVSVSIVLAIGMTVGLRGFKLPRRFYVGHFAGFDSYPVEARLLIFLVASGALVVIANIVLAYALLPANPDSIVYRLPRAYWYLAQGSLKHFMTPGDPRAVYYPFNGVLAYVPLVHFQLGPRWFSLFSLFCWMMCGLTTYEFARNLGGPRVASTAAAWIVCLTPNVLLQALSTNDEIIAAVAMLTGLFFVQRWYLSRQRLDLLIGIVGVGLSVGTKLHVTFYAPLLLAIALAFTIHWRSTLAELEKWKCPKAIVGFGTALCIGLVLGCGFLLYNYVSAGRLSAWAFNAQVLNQPFNWRVAVQTNILFAAQTMLTPLADLHLALNSSARAQHYEAFNRLVAPLFQWAKNSPEYVSAFYRFTGVNSSSAVTFNEVTIFIGFTWLVWLVAAARLFTQRRTPQIIWGRFQVISLPVWFITFAASVRYIDGFATYLTYPTIIAGPALVYAFAPIRRLWLSRVRWSIIGLVAATHCFFALSILMSSSPRNLIVVKEAPRLPLSRGFAIDGSTLAELAKAQDGIVDRSLVWGQPYWAFMAYNPAIPHYFASVPAAIEPFPGIPKKAEPFGVSFSRFVAMPAPDDKRLNIYSFRRQPHHGDVAMRIPDKPSPGLTWIGDIKFSAGPEWVFAAGNDVATRHPGRDKYIVLKFNEVSNFGHRPQPYIDVHSILYGLGPSDDLGFRYEIRINGILTDETEWNISPQAKLMVHGLTEGNGVLTVFVRNNATGEVYRKDVSLRDKEPV